jgi:hypothetical protein
MHASEKRWRRESVNITRPGFKTMIKQRRQKCSHGVAQYDFTQKQSGPEFPWEAIFNPTSGLQLD